MQNQSVNSGQAHTFICHASEDKGAIARPIHEALTKIGVHSWLDESEIRLGQSIRQKIDEGLVNCRSATVILSRSFFAKNWTQYELDGIFQRMMQEGMPFFPIRHGITMQEIRDNSPSLAGLSLWNSSDHSPENIATEIATQLGISKPVSPQQSVGTTTASTDDSRKPLPARAFGTLYIAPAQTPQLLANTEPEVSAQFLFLNTGGPKGWIPVLDSNEELEYILEEEILRVQLNWGSTLRGAEIMAKQMLSGHEPFALTVRRTDGSQLYFSSVINLSPSRSFMGHSNRSGWITLQIR